MSLTTNTFLSAIPISLRSIVTYYSVLSHCEEAGHKQVDDSLVYVATLQLDLEETVSLLDLCERLAM